MSLIKDLKNFWNFIWHGTSIYSYVAFFIFAIVVLNVVYPLFLFLLSHTVGINDVVAVVTGSMVHDASVSQTYYAYMQELGFTPQQLQSFPHNNGLNMGDLLLVWKKKPEEIKVGDVIVFKMQDYLIIHRVIKIDVVDGEYYYTTKGDHNPGSIASEINITYDRVKGVAGNRIPFLGIPKMLLTNFLGAVRNVL